MARPAPIPSEGNPLGDNPRFVFFTTRLVPLGILAYFGWFAYSHFPGAVEAERLAPPAREQVLAPIPAAGKGKAVFEKELARDNQRVLLHPEDPEAFFRRGLRRFNYAPDLFTSQNLDDFSKALALNPRHAEAAYYRGRVIDAVDNFSPQMYRDYSLAIELKPDFAEAYLYRGKGRLREWEFEAYYGKTGARAHAAQAMADFNRAIQLNPQVGLAFALHGYGQHLLDRGFFSFGKDKEARLDFERAVALAPNDPAVFFWYGKYLRDRKDYPKALECLDRVIQAEPYNHNALSYRAGVYFQMRRMEEGNRDNNRSIEVQGLGINER